MQTGQRAGGRFAGIEVAAVQADPDGAGAPFEDLAGFYILAKLEVALLVEALDLRDELKSRGDGGKAFLPGYLGEIRIHLGPLIMLARCGVRQIVNCAGYAAAVQLLEPELRVLLLIRGRFLKDPRDLHVAILFCLGGIIGVLVARLALSCEGGHEIRLGAASFKFHVQSSFLWC